MNRWKEEFNNHPIHETIKDISELINAKVDNTDGRGQSEKRRLVKVLTLFEDTLKGLDPELVPYGILDKINTSFRNESFLGQIRSYNSNGNSDHLKEANNYLNNALLDVPQLLALSKKLRATTPVKRLEKLVDEFTDTIASKNKELVGDIDTTSDVLNQQNVRLDYLSNAINTQQQQADALVEQWQGQYSEEQNKRDADFTNVQTERANDFETWKEQFDTDAKTQLKTLIDDSNETLTTGQQAFDSQISSFIEKAQTQIETLIDNSNKTLTDGQQAFDDKIDNLIEEAEDRRKKILDLYELVAGDSIAGGYKKNADDEKKAANFWRVISIFFIILAAGWLGFSYTKGNAGTQDTTFLIELVGQIIKGFPITAILLFGAVYSAKQSNGHRESERRTRRFALEVNAIDPFIASLDEEDQKALKHKLSEQLFGQQENGNDAEGKVIDEHAFSVLIKGITDILKAK